MNNQPRKAREIVFYDDVQDKVEKGLEKVYSVAKAAYGPRAGIALVEQFYGEPLASRDGVSNVRQVFLADPVENMVAKIAKQASGQNDKKVGDGTTAVVILAYHLYKAARKRLAGGHNRMEVSADLERAARKAVEQIDALKRPVDDDLQSVAKISAGDEAIGEMIADVIGKIGSDGGVVVQDFEGLGIYDELVEGFYFPNGLVNPAFANDPVRIEYRQNNVMILIAEKPLATTGDIAPILEKVAGAGIPELLVVGDVRDEALAVLAANRLKGIVTSAVVDAPMFARSLFMQDLAAVTGGKVLAQGASAKDFELDMLGAAEEVVVTPTSTTIIGREGEAEVVEARVAELREELKEATHPTDISAIKERIARLTGKVAILRVGGATPVEQQEVKLRVQDAVAAVQAAVKEGICPGGGVTLARLKDVEFADAFKQPFRQLMDNASENPDARLAQVEKAPDWHGFDLKNMTEEPVELLAAGVVDPALVLKEVVTNAVSIVSKLITASVAITYEDRNAVRD